MQTFRSVLPGAVLAGFCFAAAAGPCLAAGDERLLRLAPADQELARRMTEFIGRMEQKHLQRIGALNGNLRLETLVRETEDTDYFVKVARGPVVEKAGTKIAVGKRQQPGRKPEGLIWSRFHSLDVHPGTPLVGMLHATIVVQFYENGESAAGGWLGVMNGTRQPADMLILKNVTDAHFAKYGRDSAVYRRLLMKGTEDTVAEFRRRPDDSGVSFYGPPVFPGDTARSFQFVSELFEQFVDAYLDIVAKRAGSPHTAADVAAQEAMRKRWFIDQQFSDPFASKLVPYEVWWLSNLPPEIRF